LVPVELADLRDEKLCKRSSRGMIFGLRAERGTMRAASKTIRPLMLGIAVPALLLAGFFHSYPIEILAGTERTIVLDPVSNPITPRAGLSYFCDLTRTNLQDRADNTDSPPELRLRFFENDEPLVHEIDHGRIETQPGLYSHWDHYIAFSPRHGKPDGEYSIRYLTFDKSRSSLSFFADPRLWTWTAAICLLSLALIGVVKPNPIHARGSLLLFLALAGGVAPHLIKSWNVAETTADSRFYVNNSARPPLYPWFIAAVKGDAAWSESDFCLNRTPLPTPSAAILNVIRAQRLVLWTSFLIAAWAASLLVSRPLSVLFFFALHRNSMLLPDFENSVMSEPLASALLLLVVAAFCVITARQSLWLLPLLAAEFGGLVLTRSAGAFAISFLTVATIILITAYRQRMRALARALSLTGIVGATALALLLCNSHARNGVWTLAPLKNWERVAFALQTAEPTDVDAMPDADCRQFLDAALGRRGERTDAPGEFDLNRNCWDIAYPLAQHMFVERYGTADLPEGGQYSPPLFRYVNGLFSRVADAVLLRHRNGYWSIVAHSFFTRAARDCTRLHWGRLSFWWLIGLGFLGCFIGRNRCALAGATCFTAHLGNLVVMSCFELPLDRYVYFSEWLCLFGLLLAGVGCGRRLLSKLSEFGQKHEESGGPHRVAA
jgi:hypothetical protein